MKRAEQIEHRGTVISIGDGFVRVNIEVNEACGGCSARSSCAMGQGQTREITIYTRDAKLYSIGEQVMVGARQKTGIMAVVLCYAVPLLVLMAALVATILMGASEGVAAISALSATAIYYAVLGLFHKRIAAKVTFTITKR